ncbi:preprotein translocase subunit SecA [Tuwongella immobilis]|uniref:Protein translocase subunit SecA n=1 Tax=Tuwongella immobilis TaxID=692036 RepID=A0A6C2YT94_9BACT|nr:preprotein translocase subunit SecA [Tuwongella immobilis]VIP04686.1 preprotein translocase subunit : Protein translocase subunit SecA OS=Pirellula staleyi (strain ATCC 27377 / DSM 6068 / ICPB 4128) GN=secA PE=3 SV=1: SecA_DEAD: SecA_PP_bind: SecA_SW: SecA_SW: SEC-C [Tuwongella immobilis]VTS06731.1 preprotein translocase subunit : Protein translocase subunit SecA OS=Pirellula staleyi (strain ATCC 27377 / DSM 6068 / ICPB 4128) GN=secA PE=3 SV=1: SecA_DEAD: SecA_PP_bind: SecA_SW: SecA_SW: SEC-C 
MATNNQVQSSLLDRVGESFSRFFDGFFGLLTQFLGSSNDRMVKGIGYIKPRKPGQPATVVPGSILDRINQLEPTMQQLSDEELREQTAKFRARYQAGETLEDLLPEAFAACREAGKRAKKMRHFDVQIVGGVVLHRGGVAEMRTGEGKTLVATLPAYLNALTGKGVHVVTVNDYLARRDCEWMLPIYQALGVSAGYIQSESDPVSRRNAYACDITYGTNSEFGFDYLRDNMKPARWGDPMFHPSQHQVQRNLFFAIIDEVDNILIDEARTPLIISGPAFTDLARYEQAHRVAVQLTEMERKARKERARAAKSAEEMLKGEDDPNGLPAADVDEKGQPQGVYFTVREKERSCHLTDAGVREAERLAGVESFYTAGNMEWPHLIDNALKALHLYHRDRHYMIAEHEGERKIIIIDEFTGRAMFGRQWSDGLHQSIEAKHVRDGVKIKQETQTLATITLQNFFKLYDKVSGMTGTAMTEATEFYKIYKLDVVEVPTNRVTQRIDSPDLVFLTEKDKWNAVVEAIENIHKYDVFLFSERAPTIQNSMMERGGEKVYPAYIKYDGVRNCVIFKGTLLRETDTTYEVQAAMSGPKVSIPKSEVQDVERKGRPVLIGTTDVAKSEMLAAKLKQRGVKYELLNAKPENVARESEIVAQAGRLGAVTISTNMAGRGTDIILGGNPEALAWARLKDSYRTRLDVPEDVWKTTVEEIEAREKMSEEKVQVIALGGLHIIGTERHESRRIDNQLRGRAGRQGDPGSARFYVSLQDDLMRLFAPEWAAKVLMSMGMREGDAIESPMVSKRIATAQRKVEEMHFEQRKNLLEYDEVMDVQRKLVYGGRQAVLNGRNCKRLIQTMIDKQLREAMEKYLDEDFGADTFATFAANRLNVKFDARDFRRCDFTQAESIARDRALSDVPTFLHEAMEENLSVDDEPGDWKWQEMVRSVNARYGLKLTEQAMKKIGRDDLMDKLTELANESIASIDLDEGKPYLEDTWGAASLIDWLKNKFQVRMTVEELGNLDNQAEIFDRIQTKVQATYHQRAIEVPVLMAMSTYMPERSPTGGPPRLNREGLLDWARSRFREAEFSEEDFRTLPRNQLRDRLLQVGQTTFPKVGETEIIAKVSEAMAGAKSAELADAKELTDWMEATFHVGIKPEDLVGFSEEQVSDVLLNIFDVYYRPEIRTIERSLVLQHLDSAWKKHLLTMDHLRSAVGLVGYGQMDPKTEYKREGMKEFEAMWKAYEDHVTDAIFRIEDMQGEEDVQEVLWAGQAASHARAASATETIAKKQVAEQSQSQSQTASGGGAATSEEAPKVATIRSGPRVGRNDPCPCGSGKKYKNCHMRIDSPTAN